MSHPPSPKFTTSTQSPHPLTSGHHHHAVVWVYGLCIFAFWLIPSPHLVENILNGKGIFSLDPNWRIPFPAENIETPQLHTFFLAVLQHYQMMQKALPLIQRTSLFTTERDHEECSIQCLGLGHQTHLSCGGKESAAAMFVRNKYMDV